MPRDNLVFGAWFFQANYFTNQNLIWSALQNHGRLYMAAGAERPGVGMADAPGQTLSLNSKVMRA